MMYRHSLFFAEVAEAEQAGIWVHTYVDGMAEIYISYDEDSRNAECRFWTAERLPDRERRSILGARVMQGCLVYAFNCDDG